MTKLHLLSLYTTPLHSTRRHLHVFKYLPTKISFSICFKSSSKHYKRKEWAVFLIYLKYNKDKPFVRDYICRFVYINHYYCDFINVDWWFFVHRALDRGEWLYRKNESSRRNPEITSKGVKDFGNHLWRCVSVTEITSGYQSYCRRYEKISAESINFLKSDKQGRVLLEIYGI